MFLICIYTYINICSLVVVALWGSVWRTCVVTHDDLATVTTTQDGTARARVFWCGRLGPGGDRDPACQAAAARIARGAARRGSRREVHTYMYMYMYMYMYVCTSWIHVVYMYPGSIYVIYM